jgi:hypothetical protein
MKQSMISLKVEVKVDTINVRPGDVISSLVMQGSIGLTPIGRISPSRSLPGPVAALVSSLF